MVDQLPERPLKEQQPVGGPLHGLLKWFSHHLWLVLLLVLAVACGIAWRERFVQDDAFISLRYARNLADGYGLVWNPGERVEGYTNFLWTLMMGLPHLWRLDPVGFSQVIGIAALAGSVVATWGMGSLLVSHRSGRVLAVLILATNYSFLVWATGGMETQLQACLIAMASWVFLRGAVRNQWSAGEAAALSIVSTLAVLTRMDSILVVGAYLILVALRMVMLDATFRRRLTLLSFLLMPVIVVVVSWLAWRVSYYGDIVPNTYFLKVASLVSWRRGLEYIEVYLVEYGLLPFICIGIVALGRIIRSLARATLVVAVLGWYGYMLAIGGDFMEFRMMVPVWPMSAVLVAWLLADFIHNRAVASALTAALVISSCYHAVTYLPPVRTKGIEPIRELVAHFEEDQDWDGVGRLLGDAFSGKASPVLAAVPVGAVGYFSELPVIDMQGLYDRWVARNAPIVSSWPGHQRLAPLSYLVERGVNLVVGFPWLVSDDEALAHESYTTQEILGLVGGRADMPVPDGTTAIQVPLGTGRTLVMWHLVQDTTVNEVAHDRDWRVVPVISP